MKKCSYCGAEYPDDSSVCLIDQNPLTEEKSTSDGTAVIAVEHNLPIALVIASYVFFAIGVVGVAKLLEVVVACVFLGMPHINAISMFDLLFHPEVICLWISRGLRRCSRVWRIFALFFNWWFLFGVILLVINYFFWSPFPNNDPYYQQISGIYLTRFLIEEGLMLLLIIWLFRVLTRPDVRSLFYDVA